MVGYTQNKDAVLTRLRRVEGQIRGLARMVESDTYCPDVLTQVSAATRALQSVALELLGEPLTAMEREDALGLPLDDREDKALQAARSPVPPPECGQTTNDQ